MAKNNEIAWLVSYGDTITLLICLLITIVVVLQGQSEQDTEWVADQVHEITEIFRESYPDTNLLRIYPRASSFKITLSEDLFQPCKDNITQEVKPIIMQLGRDLLHEMHKLTFLEKPSFIDDSLYLEISIEGHTDNIPLPKGCVDFENNWQLSSARAYETMKVITENKYIDDNLKQYFESISIRGYADSQPNCTNETADGRACNRRIEIIFIAYLMGGGTYYSDSADN